MLRWQMPLLVAVLWVLPPAAAGEETQEPDRQTVRGYADQDRDGVNDRFRDADGDGVDDVSGQPYPHRFAFVDADQDGVNDTFIDRDGDGVNDRDARYLDRDGDGICDNVIDYDGDRTNDVTGARYSRRSLGGFRYGLMDEERGVMHRRFVDEDGDGMRDEEPAAVGRDAEARMDRFVDEDGDGICDGRTLRGGMRRDDADDMGGMGGEGMGGHGMGGRRRGPMRREWSQGRGGPW
ncbi:MAG: hypothetical protein AB1505_00290 [Candidatus Latescibacterota bacterium]